MEDIQEIIKGVIRVDGILQHKYELHPAPSNLPMSNAEIKIKTYNLTLGYLLKGLQLTKAIGEASLHVNRTFHMAQRYFTEVNEVLQSQLVNRHIDRETLFSGVEADLAMDLVLPDDKMLFHIKPEPLYLPNPVDYKILHCSPRDMRYYKTVYDELLYQNLLSEAILAVSDGLSVEDARVASSFIRTRKALHLHYAKKKARKGVK